MSPSSRQRRFPFISSEGAIHAPARVASLSRILAGVRPHVVHATHFFCNLYATVAARLCGAVSVGSIRSDLEYELGSNPYWGETLLRAPDLVVVNSGSARQRAIRHGVDPERLEVLPNAIDLEEFDRAAVHGSFAPRG